MTIVRFQRCARTIVYAVALALLALAVTGCKSSQSFAVAKFHATTVLGSTETPPILARFDGDLFVGWASTNAVASIEPKIGGVPFYQAVMPAGRAVVFQRSQDFKWSGTFPGEALPARAAQLFTENEKAAWGLQFQAPPGNPGPGDTVPAGAAQ
jgi:hypothetical protein